MNHSTVSNEFHGTTVLAVRRNGKTAVAADGQVTFGQTVLKHKAVKLRRLYNGKVVAGFAGSVADSLALYERFEKHLDASKGKLKKAAVDLAKDWRTDRILRRLEAFLLAADAESMLVISGSGEVIEPDEDAVAIGSGGPYALAAAKAFLAASKYPADQIANESLRIAADLCIYTNSNIHVETIE
ncbi:MAG: ATP-dependent protease subunit HslV [bacterium]